MVRLTKLASGRARTRRVVWRAVYARRHPFCGHSWLSLFTFGLLRRARKAGQPGQRQSAGKR
ncbi:MAG TPA: hypothetical protein VGS80_21540 [Ktedonobacterales bacterium]|nr:hypothetical protein [Ktedonobacterales bacterium]